MIITLFSLLLASATSVPELCKVSDWDETGSSIEMDVEELLEMIPYEQMVNLGMEYAMADSQVKTVMQYISTDEFRNNVGRLQASEQFVHMAEASRAYNIDVYAIANKINSALDMPPLHYGIGYQREKRSPGDGVIGLVKDAIELAPLEDMKEAYIYKVDRNPDFKCLMNKILNGEAKKVLQPLGNSKPFQDIKKDLKDMGIPLEELEVLISGHLLKFFSLSNSTTTSTPEPAVSPTATHIPLSTSTEVTKP